ncbi:tyrosyl-DNA phosphodiesterase I [Mycena latifolia]|nr:tyrosyl-DNA phosphodiesterase I [Mycena latifolia]
MEEKRWKAAHPVKMPMTYAGGALRLTRTRGRSAVNTISLKDLIHSYELSSAFVYSFFIENDHLFQYFPFKKNGDPGRPHCPIFVGRDMSQDVFAKESANLETIRPKSATEWDRVIKTAQATYSEMYGSNFHAFYPRKNNGCMHSKLMILIYDDFLRLVITSANLMEVDVVLGDNHWFIQDFPRLTDVAKKEYAKTDFEKELIRHLKDLECPDEFLNTQLRSRVFDFSAAKVFLVTSKPGSFSGEDASKYGQLRLRRVVSDEILEDYEEVPKMTFEVCVGSIGRLEALDVVKNLLESCAGGSQKSKRSKPALKMVFPTWADVQSSNTPMAGNISSHIDWKNLEAKDAEYLKGVFYHYTSKDAGCMFHMKSILALHANAPDAPPVYMYIGSHNFSAGAWGNVHVAVRNNLGGQEPLRVQGIANLECGIVVKGSDIEGMLETSDWQDIVPYMRPSKANKYKQDERPYTAPASLMSLVGLDGEEGPEDDSPNSGIMELINNLLIRASRGGGVVFLNGYP